MSNCVHIAISRWRSPHSTHRLLNYCSQLNVSIVFDKYILFFGFFLHSAHGTGSRERDHHYARAYYSIVCCLYAVDHCGKHRISIYIIEPDEFFTTCIFTTRFYGEAEAPCLRPYARVCVCAVCMLRTCEDREKKTKIKTKNSLILSKSGHSSVRITANDT